MSTEELRGLVSDIARIQDRHPAEVIDDVMRALVEPTRPLQATFRSEAWHRDGRTAMVDVRGRNGFEWVEITYELLAQMLTDLGWTREDRQ